MYEKLLRDLFFSQLLIHSHHQPLRLGIHITNLRSSFVMEEYMVALTRCKNTNVKLILLGKSGKEKINMYKNVKVTSQAAV